MSRSDLIKLSVEEAKKKITLDMRDNNDQLAYILKNNQQLPLSIHTTMFVKCIEMLGTQRQQ